MLFNKTQVFKPFFINREHNETQQWFSSWAINPFYNGPSALQGQTLALNYWGRVKHRCVSKRLRNSHTVYPKKYAQGFCFAVLCCGYTLIDFPLSIRLTSLALWQSNDCPSASKATLMNMDKYFMWIHYERLHNHNKAKQSTTNRVYFLGYTVCPNLNV